MNDRFKFRCWNKINNKMYKVHSLHIGTGKVIVTSLYGNTSIKLDGDKILMQCTGLKDKNGKLIYEGDMVKHSKSNQQYKVQWNDKGFLQLDDYAMARSSKFLEENYEVIGNIYENKELLEEE